MGFWPEWRRRSEAPTDELARGVDADLPNVDETFRRLVEEIPLITYIEEAWPNDTQYYVSPHVKTVLGITQAQYVSMGWEGFFALVHPDDVERLRGEVRHFAGTGEPLVTEYRMVAADGRVVWIRDVGTQEPAPRDAPVHEHGYMLDVTEQKNAEAALAASEALMRDILESIEHGIVVLDREHRYLHWNRFMERLRGIPETEVLGRLPEDVFPDLEQIGMSAMLDRALGGDMTVVPDPYEYPQADGRSLWMSIAVGPLRETSGAIVGTTILVRDVTEAEGAKQSLRHRDATLEAVSVVAGLLLSRPLDDCGPEVVERLGTALEASRAWVFQDELVDGTYVSRHRFEWCAPGIDPDPWTDTRYDESAFKRWLDTLLTGETIHGVVSAFPPGEREILEASGIRSVIAVPIFVESELWGEIGFDDCSSDREWAAAERQALGTAANVLGAAIARQNAEQALRRSEEMLRQAQKMEAVGRLAGGIAHDFNNVLTVIRGYSALLLARAEEADPDRDDLLAIVSAADQAADLTRQLLTFSRGQPPSTTSVDLNTLVAETGSMLGRILGENIELDLWLPAYPVVVQADPSGLQQALVNLAVNARDAMPEGGSLIVETRIEPSGGPGLDADAPVGVLRVSDTGHGMDEETRARVFEPFFTTKPTGMGTGLGLATVYGIVTQAGGNVTLDTSPGKGATFTIHLPALREAAVAPPAPTLQLQSHGNERVLLAEDEDAVRMLISTVLTERGYTVLEARDGLEALEIAERFGDSLDILLTDVVMPQMTGVELAHRLRDVDPSLPVLFVSGHMGADRPAAWPDPDVLVLQKPFTPHELVGAVRAALDAHGAPAAAG